MRGLEGGHWRGGCKQEAWGGAGAGWADRWGAGLGTGLGAGFALRATMAQQPLKQRRIRLMLYKLCSNHFVESGLGG